MKGKRCQVCDGPVVNGRCKFCGMPYRKDEVLYHLNESRSDHYRHASKKARETMRRQQIPLGDCRPEPKRTEAKNTQSVFKNVDIRGQRKPYTSPTVEKKKKSSLLGVIATFVLILVGIVPEFMGYIEDRISSMTGSSATTEVSREIFSRWQDESDVIYEIAPDYGVITVGEDIETGDYIAYVEAGSADFCVISGENEQGYHLQDEEDVEYLALNAGDQIEILQTDGIYGTVCFYTQMEE